MSRQEKLSARLHALTAKGPLRRFWPVTEAMDEAFFGTPRTATSAPFARDGLDVKRLMTMVIIALTPAVLAAFYHFGWRVMAMILVSYAVGGAVEVSFSVIRRKPVHEGFLVTGLIFPLVLPPTLPLWMVAVGVFFGTFFGKEVFGGTGRNVFNPALVGRLFISLAFPAHFGRYWGVPLGSFPGGFGRWTVDAVSQATPLIVFKGAHAIGTSPLELLLGQTPGTLGETFRLGIILGGLFLLFTRVADWRAPLAYIGTTAVAGALLHILAPARFAPVWFQLLSGGLLFGAFFMATDPVTAPFTMTGRWLAGILLGILTLLIRSLSGLTEGVMFSILIMNAVAPLIDSAVVNASYRRTTVRVRRHAA